MKYFGEKLLNIQYTHRIRSYAVIIENESIAVIKSTRLNAYFLIGGGIENGESEKEALQREAFEEVGYKILIHNKIGVATEYLYAEIDKKYIAKECHFYRAELAEKINEQSENELIWIGVDEIGELYHECHQWIVRQELKI